MKKLGHDILKRNDTDLHNELMMRKIEKEEDARVQDCGKYIFLDQIYRSHCGKNRMEIISVTVM